jgi:hypothetical protein
MAPQGKESSLPPALLVRQASLAIFGDGFQLFLSIGEIVPPTRVSTPISSKVRCAVKRISVALAIKLRATRIVHPIIQTEFPVMNFEIPVTSKYLPC